MKKEDIKLSFNRVENKHTTYYNTKIKKKGSEGSVLITTLDDPLKHLEDVKTQLVNLYKE